MENIPVAALNIHIQVFIDAIGTEYCTGVSELFAFNTRH